MLWCAVLQLLLHVLLLGVQHLVPACWKYRLSRHATFGSAWLLAAALVPRRAVAAVCAWAGVMTTCGSDKHAQHVACWTLADAQLVLKPRDVRRNVGFGLQLVM